MPAAHARHVKLLLHLLRVARERESAFGSAPTPPELFLVHEEERALWELVGFRMRGCDAVVLGAMRFRRQARGTDPYARRSLANYLCSPPKEVGVDRTPRPAGLLELRLPGAEETIDAFRRRMAAGGASEAVFVDVEMLDFAFDFRLTNPSTQRVAHGGSPAEAQHLFRTTEGHVISAVAAGLHVRLHREGSFVALRDAVQHTARGAEPLPTLIMHRSALVLAAPMRSKAERDALLATVPLRAAAACARPLLAGA